MPDYKLVSLEQMKILAGQTKSYVDGKVGSASDIQWFTPMGTSL